MSIAGVWRDARERLRTPAHADPAVRAFGGAAALDSERSPARLLAQARHENFPVASRLLPRRLRGHLLAVYGFARLVDDVGDEADGERGPLLDLIEQDLSRVYGGTPRLPVLRTLAATVSACEIPQEPLARLIAANRQDQVVHRYDRYTDLLSYCELSANPVGHVVLHIFGAATPVRLRLSDRVCTALQLIEHWQDVAEDLARGRRYLPAEDLTRFGCREDDLAAPTASPQVRALIADQTRRAATLLDAGAPLVGTLSGFARLATAGYVAGGRAALAAITRADHDVLRGAPRPTRRGVAAETIRLVMKGGDGHDHGQPGG